MIELATAPGEPALRLSVPGSTVEIIDQGGSMALRLEAPDGAGTEVRIERPDRAAIVKITDGSAQVTVSPSPELRLTAGLQGPRGLSGDGGAGTIEAGETIGGHRAVYIDAAGLLRKATSDGATPKAAVAILRNATTVGTDGIIYKDGSVNGFTGLTPGARYFLGSDGAITETPPTAGIYQALGTASSASILIVEIGEPVYQ